MSADSNLFRLHLILSWEGSTTLTATSCRPNRWGKGPAPERHRSPRHGGHGGYCPSGPKTPSNAPLNARCAMSMWTAGSWLKTGIA